MAEFPFYEYVKKKNFVGYICSASVGLDS